MNRSRDAIGGLAGGAGMVAFGQLLGRRSWDLLPLGNMEVDPEWGPALQRRKEPLIAIRLRPRSLTA